MQFLSTQWIWGFDWANIPIPIQQNTPSTTLGLCQQIKATWKMGSAQRWTWTYQLRTEAQKNVSACNWTTHSQPGHSNKHTSTNLEIIVLLENPFLKLPPRTEKNYIHIKPHCHLSPTKIEPTIKPPFRNSWMSKKNECLLYPIESIESMGRLYSYLPFLPWKSTIHVGKYTARPLGIRYGTHGCPGLLSELFADWEPADPSGETPTAWEKESWSGNPFFLLAFLKCVFLLFLIMFNFGRELDYNLFFLSISLGV